MYLVVDLRVPNSRATRTMVRTHGQYQISNSWSYTYKASVFTGEPKPKSTDPLLTLGNYLEASCFPKKVFSNCYIDWKMSLR